MDISVPSVEPAVNCVRSHTKGYKCYRRRRALLLELQLDKQSAMSATIA